MPEKEKNRFSQILEQLMNLAEIKNAALAKALQYDVSYISKWISGRMLPAEKTKRNVLQRISSEIVRLSSAVGIETLYETYQVANKRDLEQVIFDNLEAEYDYVQDMQRLYGSSVAPKTIFFVDLNPAQYISKMHHPVLRRVSRLYIMAQMDLLALAHEYRIQIIQGNIPRGPYHSYPDVHFSLMIDLSPDKIDPIYDPIFLINMMKEEAGLDFHLYKGKQAAGRMLFTVKDDFMISGILTAPNRCMSVTVSSEADNCNPLYDSIRNLCTREMLLYRDTTMADMVNGNGYIRSILALHQHWMIGQMTEHFLPDDLFEELLEQTEIEAEEGLDKEMLRNLHRLTKKAMEETRIKVIFHRIAFSNLAVESEIDFFDHKISLTLQQRIRYLKYLLELCTEQDTMHFRLIHESPVPDFQYAVTQSIFLSDTFCYMRLNTENGKNNLAVLNHPEMKMIFERFFEIIWSDQDDMSLSDHEEIASFIRQMIHRTEIIASINTENTPDLLEYC